MKKVLFVLNFIFTIMLCLNIKPIFVSATATGCSREQDLASQPKTLEELEHTSALYNFKNTNNDKPGLLAIVIDDFGSYERGGVDELLNSNVDITCAIMPFVDNSVQDYSKAISTNKEVILHMPMQAHVNLPESWYGPIYIGRYESPDSAIQKLEKCFKEFPEAKGFNIHIGSGASQNKELMAAMYNYADKHNMFFLDSRTILADKCEEACNSAHSIYLGRDVFLEPEKNRSYAGVTSRLQEAANIAKEKGYAIVIGHVGAEGGINTARAIIDFSKTLEDQNIKIVPLSTIYNLIKDNQFK